MASHHCNPILYLVYHLTSTLISKQASRLNNKSFMGNTGFTGPLSPPAATGMELRPSAGETVTTSSSVERINAAMENAASQAKNTCAVPTGHHAPRSPQPVSSCVPPPPPPSPSSPLHFVPGIFLQRDKLMMWKQATTTTTTIALQASASCALPVPRKMRSASVSPPRTFRSTLNLATLITAQLVEAEVCESKTLEGRRNFEARIVQPGSYLFLI